MLPPELTLTLIPSPHIETPYPHSVPLHMCIHSSCIPLTRPHLNTQHLVPIACVHCVTKWRPYPVERQRLSFLHMLRDTLLEKLRRTRSFGDLASLRPRPKSSLEVYVSVLWPLNPPYLTLVCPPRNSLAWWGFTPLWAGTHLVFCSRFLLAAKRHVWLFACWFAWHALSILCYLLRVKLVVQNCL